MVERSVEEIRKAHKKLITRMHPDLGGTDYLSAKINRARDVLLENQNQITLAQKNIADDPEN